MRIDLCAMLHRQSFFISSANLEINLKIFAYDSCPLDECSRSLKFAEISVFLAFTIITLNFERISQNYETILRPFTPYPYKRNNEIRPDRHRYAERLRLPDAL